MKGADRRLPFFLETSVNPRKSHKLLDTTPGVAHYYFLAAGEVIFEQTVTPEGSDTPEVMNASVRLNAVIQNKSNCVPVLKIGQAQQSLQAMFMQRAVGPGVDPASIRIVDVFILSISPLGRMTAEEFNAQPKSAQASMPAANALAI